jgi:hypothetical protein
MYITASESMGWNVIFHKEKAYDLLIDFDQIGGVDGPFPFVTLPEYKSMGHWKIEKYSNGAVRAGNPSAGTPNTEYTYSITVIDRTSGQVKDKLDPGVMVLEDPPL